MLTQESSDTQYCEDKNKWTFATGSKCPKYLKSFLVLWFFKDQELATKAPQLESRRPVRLWTKLQNPQLQM